MSDDHGYRWIAATVADLRRPLLRMISVCGRASSRTRSGDEKASSARKVRNHQSGDWEANQSAPIVEEEGIDGVAKQVDDEQASGCPVGPTPAMP